MAPRPVLVGYFSGSPVHCISIVNNEVGLACETTCNYSAGLKAKYRPWKKVYLQSTTIINIKTVRGYLVS